MAWVFSLSAECGSKRTLAENFAQHFVHEKNLLFHIFEAKYYTSVFKDLEENYWCLVAATVSIDEEKLTDNKIRDFLNNYYFEVSYKNYFDLENSKTIPFFKRRFFYYLETVVNNYNKQTGIDSPFNAYLMTHLGLAFYQRLKTAPSFRYALVGVEVDEFRTYNELLEEEDLDFPGLVLSESLWQEMGSSPVFQPFSSGYVWKPYEGEVYKPLISSLDLQKKFNELLLA